MITIKFDKYKDIDKWYYILDFDSKGASDEEISDVNRVTMHIETFMRLLNNPKK